MNKIWFIIAIVIPLISNLIALAQSTPEAIPFAGYTPDFTVNSTLDTIDANPGDGICADAGGQCTLRAAINESNALQFSQNIYVPAGTYILTIAGTDEDAGYTGDLDILDTVAIYGDGPDQTIIDANQIDRILHINPINACAGLDNCTEDVTQLSGLTIQGGAAPYGGGIYQEDGYLTINWTKLTDNYADGSHVCTSNAGAAYLGYGSAFVEFWHSEVTNNTTPSASLDTKYGVIAGYATYVTDTQIDQNDADWAVISPEYPDTVGCEREEYYLSEYVYYQRVSITNTTGGAFTATIQPDLPAFRPTFEKVTISGNGAGLRFTNDTDNDVLLEGTYPESSSFIDVTIANNTGVGLDLLGNIEADVTNVVIADNGINCTDYAHGIGVVSDTSCVDPTASELTVADPQLMPLIASEYQLYHSTQSGSPAENVGDYGPPVFTPMPLSVINVIASKYYSDFAPSTMNNAVERLADQLIVVFENQPYDPPANTNPNDVTNPANYALVTAGDNEAIESTACDAIGGDDVIVPIEAIQFFPYGSPNKYLQSDGYLADILPNIIINFDESALGDDPNRLGLRSYRFFVCNNLRTVDGGGFDGTSYLGTGQQDSDAIFSFFEGDSPYLMLNRMIAESYAGVRQDMLLPLPQVGDNPNQFEPIINADVRRLDLWFDSYIDANQLLQTDANLQLVAAGPDGIIETQTCGSLLGDDVNYPLTNIRVGSESYSTNDTLREAPPFYIAQVDVPLSIPSGEKYALIACDTIQEIEGTRLDGDYDGLPGGDFFKTFYTMPTSQQLMPTVNIVTGTQIELAIPDIALPEGTHYELYSADEPNSVTFLDDIAIDAETFMVSDLICGTAYNYRLRFSWPGDHYDTLPDDYVSPYSDILYTATADCAGPWVKRIRAEGRPVDYKPYDARITNLQIEFSSGMSDTASDPSNYRLYEAGDKGVIDSTSCSALTGDDQIIPLTVTNFTVGDDTVTLSVNNGNPLPIGEYAIIACEGLAGEDDHPLDGDRDGIAGGEVRRDFSVLEPIKILEVNTVQDSIATPLNDGDVRDFPFGTIDISFSQELLLSNGGSYYLLTPGNNGTIDTDQCVPYYNNSSDDVYVNLNLDIDAETLSIITLDLQQVMQQEPARLIICDVQNTNELYLDVDDDNIGGDTFILDFNVRRAPRVVGVTSDAGPLDALASLDMQTLTITFTESMADPSGDTESMDVTNPANYRLINHGPDHELQSDLCGAMLGDDTLIPINSVTYNDASFSVVLAINGGQSLTFGTYTIVVCPTVEDTQGTQLDGNNDLFPGDPYSTIFVFDVAQTDSDLYVNTTDEGIIGNCGNTHCSFREAILAANGIDAVVTIHLQPDALYEIKTAYVADYGLPLIKATVIIQGNGATLQRSYLPDTPEFGLLTHNGSTTLHGPSVYTSLTVEDLTLKNGFSTGAGGAIAGRDVYVYDCNFIDNEAHTAGALYASNDLIVERSYFLHNRINTLGSSPRYGGAIYVTGEATISHSIFEENFSIYYGGAIVTNNFAQVTIENNLFIRNEARSSGTAIWMRLSTDSRIHNNTFVNNGTINLSPDSHPSTTIYLNRSGRVEIAHNTFVEQNNYALSLGVYSDSSTMFGNIITGDGVLCHDENSDDGTASNSSIGYNVSTSSACLSPNLDNGDVLGDPQLDTLRDNGGPTLTVALGVTSPALDIVPEAECVLFEDQRGMVRPLDGDGDGTLGCDAGAFESPSLSAEFPSDLRLTLIEPSTAPPDASLYTVRAVLHNDGPAAAENVAVVFDGDFAYPTVDGEDFDSATGRWQPGDILPGTEAVIDVVFRVDREMKDHSLTLFGEVERNLIYDLDSIPDNGDPNEDDYDSLTLTVGCSIVPTVVAPGDVDGIISAIYAANDESCNPGADAFSLSPNATYIVHDYYSTERVNSHSEYTAFPLVDSNIAIDGQGSVLDFDAELLRVTPTRFFYTLQGSRLTLNNMTFQNAHGVLVRGTVIKSQGDLYLQHVNFLHNFRATSSYSSNNIVHHTIGSLLIQDSYFEANHKNHNVIEIEDALVARIERSTFYDNDVIYSVVESINTPLDVINSTFVENAGKSINNFEAGSVTVDQSTFYGNASALNSQTPTIVRNSVFSPGICSYYYGVAGEIISEGNNVLQDTSLDASQYLFNCGFDHPTDLVVENVSLLPLASYNGSTPVMRPAADSPAVDIISLESCNAAVDQRLVARPFNGTCDAGAVELALDESFGTPDALHLVDVSDSAIVITLPALPSEEVDLQLERLDRTRPSSWRVISTHSFEDTTHVDTGLVCGQTYQYRASYVSDAGVHLGQPSTALEVTTLPCERPITHTFGLYKGGQWLFYTLDGDQRYDARFNWGPQEPGWQPVIGDWNGDGIDGIGLYKNGHWLLRSVDLFGNVVDIEFDFGDTLAGAVALAGDWDGDGVDTVGLFQTGVAYLRNSNSTGVADVVLSVGSTTSVPIAGDWNGNGVDTVGLYESTTFSLAAQNSQLPPMQITFSFGPTDWQPLAGDWNDDGIDTIGIYNQGLWRMRNSNAGGSVDVGFNYGNLEGGWQPVGNFDSSPAVLNLLFAATVPTPRVPIIPGPSISTPTETAPDNHPPALDDVPIEPTPLASVVPTLEITLTPEPTSDALSTETAVPSYIPEQTQIEVVPQITPASPTNTSE